MKNYMVITALLILSATLSSCVADNDILTDDTRLLDELFGEYTGTFVLIECGSGNKGLYNAAIAQQPWPPCSTFKIWNTLIGLELDILNSPDEHFYTWDGQQYAYTAWHQDLSLIEAFHVSCVPGYQDLARTIGEERMQYWLDLIEYGNADISAGIDTFWLPTQGRKTIRISPEEQAEKICLFVQDTDLFSRENLDVLRALMAYTQSEKGTLYGKTGSSGSIFEGETSIGWYVGYIESNSAVYTFACLIQGVNQAGSDARAIVEKYMKKKKLL